MTRQPDENSNANQQPNEADDHEELPSEEEPDLFFTGGRDDYEWDSR